MGLRADSPRSTASSASSELNSQAEAALSASLELDSPRSFNSNSGSVLSSVGSSISGDSDNTLASLENHARRLFDFSSIPENFDTLSGEEKTNLLARHLGQHFTNISQTLRTAEDPTAEDPYTIKICLIAFGQLFNEIANLYTKLEETSAMEHIKLGVIQNVMDTLVVSLITEHSEDIIQINKLKKAGELIHKMCRTFFNPDDDWKTHSENALKRSGTHKEDFIRYHLLDAMNSVDPELKDLYEKLVPYLDADNALEKKLIEKLENVYNNFTEIEVNDLKIWLTLCLAFKQSGVPLEATPLLDGVNNS